MVIFIFWKPGFSQMHFYMYQFKPLGLGRGRAAALAADVIIMAVSAIDGWNEEDAKLIEHIMTNQVF
jgi:hypothetical protein